MRPVFKTAYDIAREQMRQFNRRPLPMARPIAPGVLLRELEVEDVLQRMRDRSIEEIAVHNGQVIQIESRRSLRGEVLAQFTNKARSLAR